MATDIGRINAAMGGIRALDYQGPETRQVLSHLGALSWAVKKDQAERDKERTKKAETLGKSPGFLRFAAIVEARVKERERAEREKVKPPEFLRCAADYQDAPVGTKIAKRFGSGWWRKVDDGWIDESCTVMPGSHIATAPREVLKWGGE
ncbi:hypothetical protein [Corynebacterium sp.]|uniref:hypothetical protein n=1 Tax=Corynebacterium sp. TaxID=1720 RepID=UPI0025C3248F|nr:hypothetical protein [Corynebacterium sp.]